MASIFLSYDHDDSARAAPIAAALEAHGHSLWWDRQIHGGAEYNAAIENAVETCDAVVVLWSANSVRSPWVRDEACEGRERGRLVPVLIERVKPPMGFRQYQTIDLSSWNGGKRIPRLADLLHAVDTVVDSTQPPREVESRPPPAPSPRSPATGPRGQGLSRRALIGAGTAALAAVAGGGLWWSTRQRGDPRFEALLDKARQAIGHQSVDRQTISAMQQAVAMQPRNPAALGLLALVQSLVAQSGDGNAATIVADAEQAARRALSIDPNEPNALLAMFELQGSSLDWFTRDRKLRQILLVDPQNVGAMSELILLLQATGYVLESWEWNERVLALEPLSPDFLGRRAFKLWILGHVPEADKVSDQLRALYPADQWAWYVRFKIYAYTGRAKAALAMLEGRPDARGAAGWARFWRASLKALDQPSPANIQSARAECIAGAQASGQLATEAVQVMSSLGQLDTAFEIANGILLARGPVVIHESAAEAAQDVTWRVGTQWMFTPPARNMWRDARFPPLCDGVGMTDYWRRRRVKPDYMREEPVPAGTASAAE